MNPPITGPKVPLKRLRWAPTPSGPLHIGNVFSMILTWLEARECDGEIFLRIDDLDWFRSRPEFTQEIFLVLEALELDWQLGPRSVADFEAHFSQKRSQDFYADEFHKAQIRSPELFFACDCSRKDLPTGMPYSGRCRDRGLPFREDGSVVWRVRSDLLPGAPRDIGDAVLFRKERIFAYQWVSVLEDLRWRITDAHRGEDLRSSTEFQVALCRELARRGQVKYAEFEKIRWTHHPLVMLGDKKLSKSEGAQAARSLLSDRREIFRAFLRWIGWARDAEIRCSQELLDLWIQQRTAGVSLRFQSNMQLDQLLN